jgi:hypothetical protein
MRARTFPILMAGLSVSCTVGPNYKSPAIGVPGPGPDSAAGNPDCRAAL